MEKLTEEEKTLATTSILLVLLLHNLEKLALQKIYDKKLKYLGNQLLTIVVKRIDEIWKNLPSEVQDIHYNNVEKLNTEIEVQIDNFFEQD